MGPVTNKASSRACVLCGKDPADGLASVWDAMHGERFYCHGDDKGVSCYERSAPLMGATLDRIVLGVLGYAESPAQPSEDD